MKQERLLKLVLQHGTLETLRAYAGLVGCDYDCHAKNIGQAKAMDLMQEHGVDLQVIAQHLVEHPEARGNIQMPDNWSAKLSAAMDCFVDPIVYDPVTKIQCCLGGGDWRGREASLGTPCNVAADEPELRALGMIHPVTGAAVDREFVDVILHETEVPRELTFDMVPGSVRLGRKHYLLPPTFLSFTPSYFNVLSQFSTPVTND